MISEELIILAKCLKKLNVSSFDKIEDRISFQKKIYLMQVCGVDLGFGFRWDQYGPYSEGLARNARIYDDYRDEIDPILDDFHFEEDAAQSICKAQTLIDIHPDLREIPNINEVECVEILSSLHFLSTNEETSRDLPTSKTETEKVNKLLISTKPHLERYKPYLEKFWNHFRKILLN